MKAETLKGHLDMLLLAAVQADAAHGYAIAETLRVRSAGAFDLPEGTLYPALHRLERGGLLASRWSEVGGRRRRLYSPHEQGTPRPGAAAGRVGGFRTRRSGRARRDGVSDSGVDAYVRRLREELRQRWLDDDRLVAEAREHLVDRIEDGMRRGLTREAAEQQAFREFGSPETIAACSAAERYPMGDQWGFLGMVWDRKWSVIIPALAAAVVTSITSYYVVPVRYQAEAFLEFIPVSTTSLPDGTRNHLKAMSDVLVSRTRLERIIEDLNLYEYERRTSPIDSVISQMRHDISVTVKPDEQGTDIHAFAVSFAASDPRLAQRGTERLASLFIDEHVRGADLRQTGVQLKIVDRPRLPEQPVRPSPAQFGAIGGGGGLVLGLLFVASARRRLA